MIGSNKLRDMLSYIPGVLALSLGIYLVIKQPHVSYVINQIHGSVELVEGTMGYNLWTEVNFNFRIWLYHVTNPDEVMEGDSPLFEERGPYVFDVNLKKHVISVDEEADEITFNTFRTYRFNKKQSGNKSEDDEIVMLNTAYYGSTSTISEKFPMFLGKFGNSLHYLFPDTYDIFLRAKVKDILFDGLPLICDADAHEELGLVCKGLKSKKPDIIQDTDVPNHYSYSLFDRINMTDQGPFTLNRGKRNKDALGNITAHKGRRVSKYWSDASCNLVSGTDSITWPPLNEKLPFVTVFEPDVCRSVRLSYNREEIIHGITGYRYQLDETTWSDENIQCYCPKNKKKVVECLATGLLDITKCQEAPIIFSEPHFLHADPTLLEFAQGLKPNPDIHETYILIEPTSGIPLSGSKKVQLSIKLKPNPAITLLANVSEGYFPLFWAEETSTATVEQLSPIIKAHRLLHVFKYFPWLLISIGIFLTVKIWWVRGGNNNVTIAKATAIQTQRVTTIDPVQRVIHRKADNRRGQAFM